MKETIKTSLKELGTLNVTVQTWAKWVKTGKVKSIQQAGFYCGGCYPSIVLIDNIAFRSTEGFGYYQYLSPVLDKDFASETKET